MQDQKGCIHMITYDFKRERWFPEFSPNVPDIVVTIPQIQHCLETATTLSMFQSEQPELWKQTRPKVHAKTCTTVCKYVVLLRSEQDKQLANV